MTSPCDSSHTSVDSISLNKKKELLDVSHLINNVGICRETVENLAKWGNVKESDRQKYEENS